MKYVTVKRLVLNKEEKKIRKTWGKDWLAMKREQEKNGGFDLVIADWSGYNSNQYRITHIEYDKDMSKAVGLKHSSTIVQFSDNTTMQIWKEFHTLESVLENRIEKRLSYSDLIRRALKSGKSYYMVGIDD